MPVLWHGHTHTHTHTHGQCTPVFVGTLVVLTGEWLEGAWLPCSMLLCSGTVACMLYTDMRGLFSHLCLTVQTGKETAKANKETAS